MGATLHHVGQPRIRKGRVLLIFWSFNTIYDTPEGAPRGGKLRPKWWGPLNILPQISTIFVHYLIPKVSPGTISYQKNLSKTKKKVFSRTVPFRALYHPLLLWKYHYRQVRLSGQLYRPSCFNQHAKIPFCMFNFHSINWGGGPIIHPQTSFSPSANNTIFKGFLVTGGFRCLDCGESEHLTELYLPSNKRWTSGKSLPR